MSRLQYPPTTATLFSDHVLLTGNLGHIDNPNQDPNIRGDAFKTLIVARLSYEANEQDLEREFGRFGPIERVSLGQSRKEYIQSSKLT